MGCCCGPLAGNISRNCTSAGWSDIFPNITSVCGANASQDKVRASFVAGNFPATPQEKISKAWKWWRPQGPMLIKRLCWRSTGSVEGRGVEQQCETCLMRVAAMWFWVQREKLVLHKTSAPFPGQARGGCSCCLLLYFSDLLRHTSI